MAAGRSKPWPAVPGQKKSPRASTRYDGGPASGEGPNRARGETPAASRPGERRRKSRSSGDSSATFGSMRSVPLKARARHPAISLSVHSDRAGPRSVLLALLQVRTATEIGGQGRRGRRSLREHLIRGVDVNEAIAGRRSRNPCEPLCENLQPSARIRSARRRARSEPRSCRGRRTTQGGLPARRRCRRWS